MSLRYSCSGAELGIVCDTDVDHSGAVDPNKEPIKGANKGAEMLTRVLLRHPSLQRRGPGDRLRHRRGPLGCGGIERGAHQQQPLHRADVLHRSAVGSVFRF